MRVQLAWGLVATAGDCCLRNNISPSSSICPSKQEICMVLTVEPLAPERTISCRLLLGNFSIKPLGRHALLIALLAGFSFSLYPRSMSARRLGIFRLSRWYTSRRSFKSSGLISSLGFRPTPMAAHWGPEEGSNFGIITPRNILKTYCQSHCFNASIYTSASKTVIG